MAQAFQNATPLHSLAPTQTEPPFLVAQAAVLVSFALFSVLALRRFRPACTGRASY